MRKSAKFFYILLLLPSLSLAQSLQLFDRYNSANISGANIEIQSADNHGWAGYESLDLAIKIVHLNSGTMEVGAKKIEHDVLQPDVEHTICFAANCYPPTVYISPTHATLTGAGAADSSFIAHFLFDNRVHIRGINHVSYVFYDVNNPIDSVVVNVTYNTVVLTSSENSLPEKAMLQCFPNPANETFTLQWADKTWKKATAILTLSDAMGEQVLRVLIPNNSEQMTMDVSKLPAGVYNIRAFDGLRDEYLTKIVVLH